MKKSSKLKAKMKKIEGSKADKAYDKKHHMKEGSKKDLAHEERMAKKMLRY